MNATYFIRTLPLVMLISLGTLLGVTGCKEAAPNDTGNNQPQDPNDPNTNDDGTYQLGIIPTSFPAMNIPSTNPITQAKIELGRHLFYDARLSTDGRISCSSCHDAASGFADNVSVSPGVHGLTGNRNAMTLVNLGNYENYVWNGRFKSLEEHAPGPIFNKVEMGFGGDDRNGDGYGDPDGDTIILFKNLDGEKKYKTLFRDAFGDEGITIDRIAKAIASFERTFVSNSSPFDEFNNGNKNAISANAIRGYKLFTDTKKTNCLGCHNGPNFTDGQFHSNGVSKMTNDKGRAELTGNSADIGKFRTPSLRNASVTWPYMHDGTISGPNPTAALEEVIRRYRAGGDGRVNQDERIKPLDLTDQDVADIAAFIKSLTDTKFMQNPALHNPWQ
jgi:cytochrome c peroxidase